MGRRFPILRCVTPSLPIPMISSLVLGFLLLRILLLGRSRDHRDGPLVALLALCAVQGLVISLAQHYGVTGVRAGQPIMATFVPPMAWVAFQTTAVRRFQAFDVVHLAGSVLAIAAVFLQP